MVKCAGALGGTDDGLVKVEPVLKRAPHFIDWLAESAEEDYMELRRSESTGRPVGTEDFIKRLEYLLGRLIARRAPGGNRGT